MATSAESNGAAGSGESSGLHSEARSSQGTFVDIGRTSARAEEMQTVYALADDRDRRPCGSPPPTADPAEDLVLGRRAVYKVPYDVWLEIAKKLDARDLYNLARVAKAIQQAAERCLYSTITLATPHGLDSLCNTLALPERQHHLKGIRQLCLAWKKVTRLTAQTFQHLSWLFQRLSNLRHLELHDEDYERAVRTNQITALQDKLYSLEFWNGSFELLPTLRSIHSSARFLELLRTPRPALTHLSVRFRLVDEKKILGHVSQVFRTSVIALRLHRAFREPCMRNSPIRVCARLDAPELMYLEIHDIWDDVRGQMPTPNEDLLARKRVASLAKLRTPKIRELEWHPLWETRKRPEAFWNCVPRSVRVDLTDILPLKKLVIWPAGGYKVEYEASQRPPFSGYCDTLADSRIMSQRWREVTVEELQ
ncbi:hypothetical protein OH77DRAFT_1524467 [Trametes cingulata]|nr:hypothetical protein OH77DRAFT_1524467 [Trametes cingulata]